MTRNIFADVFGIFLQNTASCPHLLSNILRIEMIIPTDTYTGNTREQFQPTFETNSIYSQCEV